MNEAPFAISEDAVLGGRLSLLQPRTGHRAGSDAILLAAAVPAQPGDVIVDFGAGVGTAGLAVLTRVADTRAHLVEIDSDLSALATENARRNGLADRVECHAVDVAALRMAGAPVDQVLCNPPFNDPAGRRPPSERTARARVATPELLSVWSRTAARVLRPGGGFTMIHRPEALGSILDALKGRFGSVTLRFIHPRSDAPANRVLVHGIKGNRGPLSVLPPFVLHDAEGHFTPEAEAIHRGLSPLT